MPLILLLLFLLLIPSVALTQSSTSTDIGNTTFYNSDGRSGTRWLSRTRRPNEPRPEISFAFAC